MAGKKENEKQVRFSLTYTPKAIKYLVFYNEIRCSNCSYLKISSPAAYVKGG